MIAAIAISNRQEIAGIRSLRISAFHTSPFFSNPSLGSPMKDFIKPPVTNFVGLGIENSTERVKWPPLNCKRKSAYSCGNRLPSLVCSDSNVSGFNGGSQQSCNRSRIGNDGNMA